MKGAIPGYETGDVGQRIVGAHTSFTRAEAQRIAAHCQRHNIPRSELLRDAALLIIEAEERENAQ